jgi:hypothetical protein
MVIYLYTHTPAELKTTFFLLDQTSVDLCGSIGTYAIKTNLQNIYTRIISTV